MNPGTEARTAEASEASDDVDSLLGAPAPAWWRRPTSWLAVLAIAAVIGGTLLSGGYGSVVGSMFGALIFGIAQIGIFYTGIDTDWFKAFMGVMLLVAVLFNNYVRRKATESK